MWAVEEIVVCVVFDSELIVLFRECGYHWFVGVEKLKY